MRTPPGSPERLRPLVGIESSQASREENFLAWRRFLEHLASNGPAVLVFEDLHWADEATLAFVGQLMAEASHAPLLIVVTTRPQLLEEQPDFVSGSRRLDLPGLTT